MVGPLPRPARRSPSIHKGPGRRLRRRLPTPSTRGGATRRARPRGHPGVGSPAGPDPRPATVVKAKQILGRSLRGAVNAGLLRTNPTDEIDVPRLEREEMRFLTPDQVATLADTIDDPYGPLVLVGAYCGLRLGELAGLRRGRVDVLARTIDVVEIVTEAGGRLHTGPPKTRAGRRTVPMPKVVADALEAIPSKLPTPSCSPESPAAPSGVRRSGAGSGNPRSRKPGSLPYAHTISGTPRSRSGSPPARRRSRSPAAPDTPRS
jgi:integrase